MAIITSVIAHIDHGKTTLIDSLVSASGAISRMSAGSLKYLDTRVDEQERGITLKLSIITVENRKTHIIIDTPGHVDFEHLVERASLLVDNLLILVDVNEGITPRTYTLVNYLENKNAVLVLNKVDKLWKNSFEEFYDRLNMIIGRINGLVKEEIFAWNRNNIILSCSTLCFGINFNLFSSFLGKENEKKNKLRNASKFIYTLKQKIDKNEVDKLITKYKLRRKSEKHIFSSILPLSDCIFSSLESFSLLKTPQDNHFTGCFLPKLDYTCNPPGLEDLQGLKGVTSFCMLSNQKKITFDNLLFVTRIFFGELSVGAKVFSCTKDEEKECIIEKIFLFGINELKEVKKIKGPILACIKSNFQKNSIITSIPNKDAIFLLPKEKIPFFRSKIALHDLFHLENFKSTLSVLSFVESPLKIKLNQYCEFEFTCQGRVQFEKILKDLEIAGFTFNVYDFDPVFAEIPMLNTKKSFLHDKKTLKIEIKTLEKAENDVIIHGNDSVLSSVVNLLIGSGPLIGERICFAKFIISTEDELEPFSLLKKEITEVFIQSKPSIVPFYYKFKCFVLKEYLGGIYSILNKFKFIALEEDFDLLSQFFVITSLVPQFYYCELVDEIRLITKGTAYLEFQEHGFCKSSSGVFDEFIDKIRIKKGLFVEHKLVEDPEKQRTLKR